MSTLLSKPFKAFTIYALVILACSVPVYYLVVDFIWLNELDEHNQIVKERIDNGFRNTQVQETELNSLVKNWEKLQPGTRLTRSSFPVGRPDSTYTITRQNEYSKKGDINRFRGLSSYISIGGDLYHLQVETNVEETHETILAITIVTLLFFTLLAIGFILLNKRIARKTWQPFRTTLENLKTFDLTKRQAISFDKTDIDEFEDLNQSLKKLIDKNISAYIQQKTFIENASHELQTPLAVLKSKLDLLLQNRSVTDEQFEILSAIELPIARITRINKNLLLLAKIENNQFSEKENLELTATADESLEMLIDYISAKQIIVHRHLKEKLFIDCNKMLLEILISNLLINAIVHNIQQGHLRIQFYGRTLTISNTGKAALDSERLFQRFVVSSSEANNSGLGLAIVKEICNRYGWRIHYSFENDLHSFSVAF